MMKTWDIRVDDIEYRIELKNNKKVFVNGEELKLKNYVKKTGLVHTEYEIPFGPKTGVLVLMSMNAPHLYIDNRDCETGQEYSPLKIPVWAYIFMVLHCINFLNGALGGAMAVVGITFATYISCNRNMNIMLRLILNILLLIVIYAVVFGVAVVLAGLL
ncbi:MAG: hypothetical protein J1E98_02110 [Lachnospiraceae bacterium]|nr:hypothetical protein [Lachnospiraceae bacterium]